MLDRYLKFFTHLNRAPGRVWSPATKNKAPHKPILLLAILDLFAQGQFKTNFIELTPDLNDLFTRYWSRVVPAGQKSTIAFPFSRLAGEGFWHLVPVPGNEQLLDRAKSISSVSQLREIALGARLDDELFELLQVEKEREVLRAALISRNFGEEVRPALVEQGQVNRQAYTYSLSLFEQAHGKAAEQMPEYRPAARDQGFRRAIVSAYSHRCALCGVRMVTPDGHTVVEAAHIVPWRIRHDDTIGNGMALCRLSHWAFDEGMMGVEDDYTVILSPQISQKANAPGLLQTLAGRVIITPADRELWPSRTSLGWHREHVCLPS